MLFGGVDYQKELKKKVGKKRKGTSPEGGGGARGKRKKIWREREGKHK